MGGENKDTITAMGVSDTQKYPGVQTTWKGRKSPKQTKEVEGMLHEITKAPLKPYQRLEILRDFLVPKIIHELILGCTHQNTIACLDRMVQKEARTWLSLPKDTPLGLLHAPTKVGGLGIPNLGTSIPLLQKKRFCKLLSNQNPIVKALTELPSLKTMLRRVNLPCKISTETVCTM